MGWNTTIVVLNDALGDIERDPDFGKNLADAVRRHWARVSERVDVRAGGHMNAASIIAQRHADEVSVLLVGGNYGRKIASVHNGGRHKDVADQVNLLAAAARTLGHRLVPISAIDELADLGRELQSDEDAITWEDALAGEFNKWVSAHPGIPEETLLLLKLAFEGGAGAIQQLVRTEKLGWWKAKQR